MKKKHIFITTIIAICSFLLGVWTTTSFGSGKVNDPRLQVFIDLYNTLKENWYYGDDETLDKMMESVYGAIYDYNVDPYTYYVAAPIEGEEQEKTYGIGILAVKNYDLEQTNYNDPILNELGILVIKTYKDSPAYNAGIKALDYIVGVEQNGEYVTFNQKRYSEIRQYIVGALDSKATFKIKRDNDFLDIEVTRNAYSISTANFDNTFKDTYTNSIVLEIEEFASTTGKEVGELLKEIPNTSSKDLIIDLRDNPGGYISTLANIASYFLPENLPVLVYEDKDGNKYSAEKTKKCDKYEFESITVLLNGNSASASEAFTLCLDYYSEYLNKFLIVGEKSYGKGIAQTEVNLSNGGKVHYTFAKVYNPSGEVSIHKEGITPDVLIPLEEYEIGNAYSYYQSIKGQLEKSIIEARK